jgi:hypothetical protein
VLVLLVLKVHKERKAHRDRLVSLVAKAHKVRKVLKDHKA